MKSLLLSLFLLIGVSLAPCFAANPLGTPIAYTGNMHKPTSFVAVTRIGTYDSVPGAAWIVFNVMDGTKFVMPHPIISARVYEMKVDCVSSHSYWLHYNGLAVANVRKVASVPTWEVVSTPKYPMKHPDYFNNPKWGERRDITDSTTNGTTVKSATEVFPLSLPLYAFVATYTCIATGEGNIDN